MIDIRIPPIIIIPSLVVIGFGVIAYIVWSTCRRPQRIEAVRMMRVETQHAVTEIVEGEGISCDEVV
jgi:hypothetical protein